MYNHGMQNNNQDQAFYNLNRKFAGRGLAKQARTSADSYGSEGMYGMRGANSAPLTLDEFANNYRRRNSFAPSGSSAVKSAAQYAQMQRNTQHASSMRNTQSNARASIQSQKPTVNRSSGAVLPNEQKKATVKAPVLKKNNTAVSAEQKRRAVKNEAVREDVDAWWNSVVLSFRRIPAGMLFMVMLCAVSLMLIVSSSVLVSDASGDYADIQDDVSLMAKQEDELLIALEVKNDLRTIEDIAVNKLGMVKKDLVTRQYIKLSDEDVIETFEEEDRNVGLSTLLSAISKGN
ncbi:MAG: hypothetical protein IJZ89_00040 [Clostridia bacterium]|nr:hypothetical protein [Clostridia bacterium]